MKPFDLNEALAGKPVRLRDGEKAIITHCIPEHLKYNNGESVEQPIIGYILTHDNKLITTGSFWNLDGTYLQGNQKSTFDIVGMWEEPKLSTEEIMEKAFQENLVLIHNVLSPFCGGFSVVGKTLNNKYILQDLDDGSLQFLHIFNKDLEWSVKE